MRLTRHATLWVAEGDFEMAGNQCASLWEPLQINVPLNAKPHACYGNVVVFYDDAQMELGRCTYHELSGAAPNLVYLGARWWEVSSGKVIQRNGRWCLQWHCCSNTARAREANAGATAERMTQTAGRN